MKGIGSHHSGRCFRGGLIRLLFVLLVLAMPALGPRMASADTFSAKGNVAGESDCQYEVDADTTALTFSAAISCSGKDYGFKAEGKLKGKNVTVTDFTVTIDGNDLKIGINKTYQLPFDTTDAAKVDQDFEKLVNLLNGDILNQIPGLSAALKVVGFGGKVASTASGFQNAMDSYDKGCEQAATPGLNCQDSSDPGPAEAGSGVGNGSDTSAGAQAETCPALPKIKGYVIVCIPTILYGKFSAGSDTILFAPGGALLTVPIGASLSKPITPVISTSGSVLITLSGIFGAGVEIDAKGGVGVAGGVIALLGPLTVTGGSLEVGKLDLSQLSSIPSVLGINVPGSVNAPGLVFASGLSAQVKNFSVAPHSKLTVDGGSGGGGSSTVNKGGAAGGANYNWGGSHGGLGGDPATSGYGNPGSPGDITGDPFQPKEAGNGGGGGYNSGAGFGASGGGSIVISATDTLAVDGTMEANGDDIEADPEGGSSGGAGGGILLQAGTIAGGGEISADGGSNQVGSGGSGGEGGGGRIALYYTHKTFTGQVHAYGGRDLRLSHYGGLAAANSGGTGTVFWQGSNEPKDGGTLIVSGDSATRWPPPGETPIEASWSSPHRTLVVENGARADVFSAAYQTINVLHGGLITLPFTRVAQPTGAIVLSPATQTMVISATTITVDGTSRIDTSIHGDPGGATGKAGGSPGMRPSLPSHGGSHGGLGGGQPDEYNNLSWDDTVVDDQLTGTIYDNPLDPGQVGAGSGGTNDGTAPGANGGGVLRLTAGALHLNGRLTANGEPGLLPTVDVPTLNASLGAGGAGGAINLRVKTLTGSGSIEADGGDTCQLSRNTLPYSDRQCGEDGSEGAGAGGRIAVRYQDKSGWTGKAHAFGGYNQEALKNHPTSTQVGRAGAGTIFWLANSEPADGGTIMINGGGATSDRRAATPLTAAMNGGHRTLILTGGAVSYGKNVQVANLQVMNGSVLTTPPGVQRLNLTVSSLKVDATSRVDLTGRGDAGAASGNNAPENGMGKSPAGTGSAMDAGGSHGGKGGNAGGTVGPTYDSAANPLLPGAGGGGHPGITGPGSPGGGVLVIQAQTLTVQGGLVADGLATDGPTKNDLTKHGFAGAGAGGSINITTRVLSGHGAIAADGGDACLPSSIIVNQLGGCSYGGGGGGGGGRIAVTYQSNSAWSGKVHAAGGANHTMTSADALKAHGGKGTVVLRKAP